MGFSLSHILLVLVVVLIVFGAGKLPRVMADVGKGLRAFKEGLWDEAEKNPASSSAEDKKL
ncbi:MAG: twin-arginine translocase TatA/TatE family subunit [Alphaproteobacteria bacterium]